MTNAKKHLLAPRARTQDQMNSHFQGTFYNLGERYTDLTKILFLVFNYGALLPISFFFGGAILLIQYYVSCFSRRMLSVWSCFLRCFAVAAGGQVLLDEDLGSDPNHWF